MDAHVIWALILGLGIGGFIGYVQGFTSSRR